MQIRHATEADREALLDMGDRFYATTSYARIAPYNRETAGALVSLMLDGVLLIAENDAGAPVGMVGLIVTPFLFNEEFTVATEVMWWVAPEARGSLVGARLLAEVEPACRQAGCASVMMMHLANSPPAAAALYQRLGYVHESTSYTKEL